MTWTTFYLVCFLVGLALSLFSFAAGGFHLPHFMHFHLPHLHLPHVHLPHMMHGHAGAPHAMHAPGSPAGRASMPAFNFATMTAFLAWFGGAGYLLTVHTPLTTIVVLFMAGASGLVGASIIFWFLVKLLLAHDRELDPADYDRVGVLARIASPIGAGGTGEIIFSLAGTRHTCGARSDTGEALARGTEVIVTRYERGIAYVRRWEEMAGITVRN
jgi:membrane protein implicated in regulation of membrane protease activity